MSDKKAAAPAEEEAPKKKGKLLVFIIAGVLLLVILGGGAVFMMKKNAAAAAAEGEDGEEVAAEVKSKKKDKKKDGEHAAPPAYFKFEKPFVAKLISEQGDSYIQIDIQLKILDPHMSESVKVYDPELRHRITMILMGKKTTDVAGAQAVQKLSNEIRVAINNIIHPHPPAKKGKGPVVHEEPADEADPDDPVQAVLFTSFIIQ